MLHIFWAISLQLGLQFYGARNPIDTCPAAISGNINTWIMPKIQCVPEVLVFPIHSVQEPQYIINSENEKFCSLLTSPIFKFKHWEFSSQGNVSSSSLHFPVVYHLLTNLFSLVCSYKSPYSFISSRNFINKSLVRWHLILPLMMYLKSCCIQTLVGSVLTGWGGGGKGGKGMHLGPSQA